MGNQTVTNQQYDADHSPAVQDYLQAIYRLEDGDAENERVTTSQLAERLDVRPASVTVMLQKMAAASPALIDYHKSHGARLTAEGRLAALRVVRSHRLLELYLHELLGYEWHEVHEEADRLEHVVSEAMLERMAETLGHPTQDPHGHAIPSADLTLEHTATVALSELAEGEAAVVAHVADDDSDVLCRFDEIGLRPGTGITVDERDAAGDWLALRVDGREPVRLGAVDAEHVHVVDGHMHGLDVRLMEAND